MLRENVVTLRLSEEEKIKLTKMAERKGLVFSDYCREQLLNQEETLAELRKEIIEIKEKQKEGMEQIEKTQNEILTSLRQTLKASNDLSSVKDKFFAESLVGIRFMLAELCNIFFELHRADILKFRAWPSNDKKKEYIAKIIQEAFKTAEVAQ